METLQIEFQSNVREKLMAFLNTFNSNEVKIISENSSFKITKNRVQESYRKLINGESKLYNIDELEAMLDKTISEYDN